MKNEIDEIIDKYAKIIYRVAYIYLKSKTDAEDIVQEFFIKYMMNNKPFNDENHRKNWIMRVTVQLCINLSKSAWKKNVVSLDYETIDLQTEEQYKILYDLDCLSKNYKMVVQLFYFEDFSIEEISKILGISESNVKTRLNRARNELKRDFEKGERLNGKI